MMEDRILRLEGEVSDLKVELGKATTELSMTNKQLEELLKTVSNLNQVLAKGQGALWAIMLVAGTVGAVISTWVKKVFGVV